MTGDVERLRVLRRRALVASIVVGAALVVVVAALTEPPPETTAAPTTTTTAAPTTAPPTTTTTTTSPPTTTTSSPPTTSTVRVLSEGDRAWVAAAADRVELLGGEADRTAVAVDGWDMDTTNLAVFAVETRCEQRTAVLEQIAAEMRAVGHASADRVADDAEKVIDVYADPCRTAGRLAGMFR